MWRHPGFYIINFTKVIQKLIQIHQNSHVLITEYCEVNQIQLYRIILILVFIVEHDFLRTGIKLIVEVCNRIAYMTI